MVSTNLHQVPNFTGNRVTRELAVGSAVQPEPALVNKSVVSNNLAAYDMRAEDPNRKFRLRYYPTGELCGSLARLGVELRSDTFWPPQHYF